ncbi:uncharacterized protein LOC108471334 [Gossypium arboreum]|uniref:uncharacterized protein LOC108471334 n=1 Tax=Gossypium arboreum TaxID=29729 RepID=UPI000819794D|nr:uncharacterized protein LOC108471334 [Gossypium arboreum]
MIGIVICSRSFRTVKQEEKQILPCEKEAIESVALEEGNEVKIGTHIAKEMRKALLSYYGSSKISLHVHRLPIGQDYKPVQQKLRRMRPDIVLKIKDEVKKQFDAGFLQEVKYSEWVVNIVPVPKKDGKVMPFGLKNARATYQRAMVTLFHDMMRKEIKVYVDDMIAKSQTEREHIEVLRKLFLRLRKF